MPLTSIDICNLALAKIGVDRQILSLEEDSDDARACALHYQPTLDQLLSEYRWGFATKRAPIALRSEDPPLLWGYRYAYPADCVNVLELEGAHRDGFDRVPYAIEGSTDGTDILTDAATVVLVYTSNGMVPGLYPPQFVRALSWRLAAALAFPRTKNARLAQSVSESAEMEVARAAALLLSERQHDPPQASSYERARQ